MNFREWESPTPPDRLRRPASIKPAPKLRLAAQMKNASLKTYRTFGAWRLLLAVLVMAQHLGVNLGTGALRDAVAYWVPGTIAVPVFFALSGFVITEAADLFYTGRPLQFLANRALRILPLYFVSLFVSILAIAATLSFGTSETIYGDVSARAISLGNIEAHLYAFIPTQLPLTTYEIIPVFWAVRVEIVFYLVTAVMIVAAIAVPFRITAAVAAMATGAIAIALSDNSNTMFRLWDTFAIQFALGAVAYLTCTSEGAGKFAAAAMCAFLLGLTVSLSNDLFRWTVVDPNRLRITAAFITMLLLTFSLLLVNLSPKWERIDQKLGELSYPLYLLHIPVAIFVKLVLGASVASVAVASLLSVGCSYLINLSIEKSVRKWRDKLRGRAVAPLANNPNGGTVDNWHPVRPTGDHAIERGRSRVMNERAVSSRQA